MLNISLQYPGQISPPNADYAYGSAKNITTASDGTGTPWEAALINDFIGWQQALVVAAGIVPSGASEKVGASQILQCLIELASGRAESYDETGAVNAYILAPRTNQQQPGSQFNGLRVRFTPSSTNTLASTLKLGTLSAAPLLIGPGAGVALAPGDLKAGTEYVAQFNGADWVIPEDIRKRLRTQRSSSAAAVTLTSDDAGGVIYCTSATAQNVVVNTGLFKERDTVLIVQKGAGQVTVSGTATVNSSLTLKSSGQYAPMTLLFESPSLALLFGDRAEI